MQLTRSFAYFSGSCLVLLKCKITFKLKNYLTQDSNIFLRALRLHVGVISIEEEISKKVISSKIIWLCKYFHFFVIVLLEPTKFKATSSFVGSSQCVINNPRKYDEVEWIQQMRNLLEKPFEGKPVKGPYDMLKNGRLRIENEKSNAQSVESKNHGGIYLTKVSWLVILLAITLLK